MSTQTQRDAVADTADAVIAARQIYDDAVNAESIAIGNYRAAQEQARKLAYAAAYQLRQAEQATDRHAAALEQARADHYAARAQAEEKAAR